MRNLQKRPEDFEKFYYRYVGKGEACGCAERIIDINEINRLAGPSVTSPKRRPGAVKRFLASLMSWRPRRG
ncbi:MAG: hypothetical protein HKO04_01095 [Silicimonas sp.]|nr:hypothetical protein [Silicimonas sp.]